MKKLSFLTVAAMALMFMSCGNSAKSNGTAGEGKDSLAVDSITADSVCADSTSKVAEAAVSPLQDEEKIKAFLQDFYEKYIFNMKKSDVTYEEAVQASCTAKMQKYLEGQYEYECMDAPCYDTACFRTGNQDGPSNESKVLKITSEGEGCYKVTFLDMGISGSAKINFVVEDGVAKMDAVKRL